MYYMYYYIDTWSLFDIVFGVIVLWFGIIEYNNTALTLITDLIDTHNLTIKMAVKMAHVYWPIHHHHFNLYKDFKSMRHDLLCRGLDKISIALTLTD